MYLAFQSVVVVFTKVLIVFTTVCFPLSMAKLKGDIKWECFRGYRISVDVDEVEDVQLGHLIRVSTIACFIILLISSTIACFIVGTAKYFIENVKRSTSTLRDAECGRGVVVAVARKCGSTTTSNVYCRDVDNSVIGHGEPFQLIKFKNRSFWTNEEVTNERLKVGSLLNCQTVSGEQSKLDGKQFIESISVKPQNATTLLLHLEDDESVYRGLEGAHGYVNLKAHRFFRAFLDKNELIEKLYTKLHVAHARIYFIQIRACTIKNERVALETMDGEQLDMPLNCRENLLLSTAPVQLQLKRPWEVGNDDVDGVAVVKYEACKFTCEGLILRYKPLVISRNKEPVQIKNGCGKVILVSRDHDDCVLFDTGNGAATGISRELFLELNLQPYRNKKREVKLAGGRLGQFEMVEIELVIRGYHFNVCALIDAPAEGTDLLVGMDIIRQLYDLGYTIGE